MPCPEYGCVLADLHELRAKQSGGTALYRLMMAIYVHLGPFARGVIAEINRRIAAEDVVSPATVPAAGYKAPTSAVM